ncbi:hypothetical protein B0813_003038 [Candidatus Fervidibacteria bacterium JGI MDM2 SSWTFF-3-K9]
MAYRRILVLMLVVGLMVVTWIVWSVGRSSQTSFVRKVSGLPSLFTYWEIYEYAGKLFAFYSPDDISFVYYRIDPITEQVIETIEIKELIYPQAVIARHYRLPDAWLAEMGFWAWEIDPQKKIAYAVKPPSQPTRIEEVGYLGIYVVDTETKEIKRFIEHHPFNFFALHPSGYKLYVESPPTSVKVLDTVKLDWFKEFKVINDFWSLFFSGFSNDGKYLFAACTGEGLVVINTEDDKVEEWGKKISEELDTKYDAGIGTQLAFSEDKSEMYAALAIGHIDISDTPVNLFNEPREKAHGGVVAIDLTQKKIVRILGLTRERECNSVVVIGNKLFVASWEGVFVIDIEQWRQQ